jgi:hypothetical protein
MCYRTVPFNDLISGPINATRTQNHVDNGNPVELPTSSKQPADLMTSRSVHSALLVFCGYTLHADPGLLHRRGNCASEQTEITVSQEMLRASTLSIIGVRDCLFEDVARSQRNAEQHPQVAISRGMLFRVLAVQRRLLESTPGHS